MRFQNHPLRFDLNSTCQAVACFLRVAPGQSMNYMRLLKLLYIVEREGLRDGGCPLTGSSVIAMERGPVLEDVFQLIRSQHEDETEWSGYFEKDRYHLRMTKDPGNKQLPRFFVEKISEVSNRHIDHDEFDMVDITHNFEEWKKNDPGKSSKPISLSDILTAVGRIDDMDDIVSNYLPAAGRSF